MIVLGIAVGAFIGFATLDFSGAIAGAFVGWVVALAWRSHSQRQRQQVQRGHDESAHAETALAAGERPPRTHAPAYRDAVAVTTPQEVAPMRADAAAPAPAAAAASAAHSAAHSALHSVSPLASVAPVATSGGDALAALEARVRAIEARLGIAAPPAGTAARVATLEAATAVDGWARGADGTLQPARAAAAAAVARTAVPVAADPAATAAAATAATATAVAATADAAAPVATDAVDATGAPVGMPPAATSPTARPSAPPPPAVPAPANALWAWFTGGNVLTRIGVVALFFGVALLLKDFAQFLTIPIEVRLLAVAGAGVALAGLGAFLARTRPGYGVSLEGAGAGILYLTIFAAFRRYEILAAEPAFALLVGVAALVVWLAVRADSQPLAALAIAGGFLAPFLVTTTQAEPARLFGYFAVLNGAIFALAWLRAWRALNVLGFVFTFALGLFWGGRFYRPEYFATVEPFLVVFFLFYVAIAVLYAARGPLEHRKPVDGLLVFGVPLLGFALQAALVADTRYGAAWSAVAVAVLYGTLSAVLWRRPQPGLALLARAFLALAIIFATIAIPFAADPRWTSGWWALEAAAVYWNGCRQRQTLARVFALALQVGAAVAFVAGIEERGGLPFLNATFLGTTLLALAALATVHLADRHSDVVTPRERALLPALLAWGIGWWVGGGVLEIARVLPSRAHGNGILAFVVGSVALALLLARALRWPRLRWFGATLLPALALAGALDWDTARTTLVAYGWLVWPLAWSAQMAALYAAERHDPAAPLATPGTPARWIARGHAVTAIAFVVWLAWEASEWVGRAFPEGTVWMPCAAAWPAIAFLWIATRARVSDRWPWRDHGDAYATTAGTVIAALLGAWFVIVNVVSPGDTSPLPYVPLVNVLDATVVAALAVLFVWVRNVQDVDDRTAYVWWGAAVFLLVNAVVFRTVHQWLDVPWRWPSLVASKPLQAALTLTWTAVALPLMLVANKRSIRPLWMVGAALLAIVVVKLFVLDLSALSGLPRVAAFLGVGALLLVIGFVAPLPPPAAGSERR